MASTDTTRAGVNMERTIRTVVTVNSRVSSIYTKGVNHSNLLVIPLQPDGTKNGTNCILLSAQSVRNKAITVHEHILEEKADLVFLTETCTWLKPKNSAVVNEMTPPGYTFIDKCRPTRRMEWDSYAEHPSISPR